MKNNIIIALGLSLLIYNVASLAVRPVKRELSEVALRRPMMYTSATTECPTKILVGGKGKNAYKLRRGDACLFKHYTYCPNWNYAEQRCNETTEEYWLSEGYYAQGNPKKNPNYVVLYCGPTYCNALTFWNFVGPCITAINGDPCVVIVEA